INSFVLREIERLRPKTIYLHADWYAYDSKLLTRDLAGTVDRIKSASPYSNIVFLGEGPVWKPTLSTFLFRMGISLKAPTSIKMALYDKLKTADATLASVADGSGVSFFSIIDHVCSDDICPVVVSGESGVELMNWDSRHLTASGSLVVAR